MVFCDMTRCHIFDCVWLQICFGHKKTKQTIPAQRSTSVLIVPFELLQQQNQGGFSFVFDSSEKHFYLHLFSLLPFENLMKYSLGRKAVQMELLPADDNQDGHKSAHVSSGSRHVVLFSNTLKSLTFSFQVQ